MNRVSLGHLGVLPAALSLGLLFAWSAAGPSVAQATMGEPTQAQPELPKQPLSIISHGGARHDFSVELARTPREQQVGLMYRTNIPDQSGMLFIWPYPQRSTMWMENCPVPEDMVFIGDDGIIRHIAENTVPESLAEISSGGFVRATLELQGGITAKLDIRVGDRVENKLFDDARKSAGG